MLSVTVIFFSFDITIRLYCYSSVTNVYMCVDKHNLTFDELFDGFVQSYHLEGSLSVCGIKTQVCICNDLWKDGTEFTNNILSDMLTSDPLLYINNGEFSFPKHTLGRIINNGISAIFIFDEHGANYVDFGRLVSLRNDSIVWRNNFVSAANKFLFDSMKSGVEITDKFITLVPSYGGLDSVNNTLGEVISQIRDGKCVFSTVPNLLMPYGSLDIADMSEYGIGVCINGLRWLSGLKGSFIDICNLGEFDSVFRSKMPIYIKGLSNFGTGMLALAAVARVFGSFIVVDDDFISNYDGEYTSSIYFSLGVLPKKCVGYYLTLDYNRLMEYMLDLYSKKFANSKRVNSTVAVVSSTGYLAKFLSYRYRYVTPYKVGKSWDVCFGESDVNYITTAKIYAKDGMPGIDLFLRSKVPQLDSPIVVTGFVKFVDGPVFKSIWESN